MRGRQVAAGLRLDAARDGGLAGAVLLGERGDRGDDHLQQAGQAQGGQSIRQIGVDLAERSRAEGRKGKEKEVGLERREACLGVGGGHEIGGARGRAVATGSGSGHACGALAASAAGCRFLSLSLSACLGARGWSGNWGRTGRVGGGGGGEGPRATTRI